MVLDGDPRPRTTRSSFATATTQARSTAVSGSQSPGTHVHLHQLVLFAQQRAGNFPLPGLTYDHLALRLLVIGQLTLRAALKSIPYTSPTRRRASLDPRSSRAAEHPSTSPVAPRRSSGGPLFSRQSALAHCLPATTRRCSCNLVKAKSGLRFPSDERG
ncbi:hypothetical protein OH76DRAFT_646306 [Lentinus brumalis]|uniref:Uncharacterized protein n=1 Tax=Lentinus brumalis TaxID=2498619 RepID=A0A371D802_9APHY|nr:hypothetical protein OH76DRAFT_646306 [Polyporus brumalis]